MVLRAKGKIDKDGLADLERRFVREYLVDLHQANAMRRADGGARKKSWKEMGYQMMQRPHVRAAVEAELRKQEQRLEINADDVKREIIRMAMFDPAHVTAIAGPDDVANLPEHVRRAIVGWSWDRNGHFIVKLAKEGALEMLAKHFGLYEADNRQKGEVTVKGGLDVSGLPTDVLAAILKAKDAALGG